MQTTYTTREQIRLLLQAIDHYQSAEPLLSEDVQNELIPKFIDEWIHDKPWKNLRNPLVECARHSPTFLKAILNDGFKSAGKITYAVFGKRPNEIEHYYHVYPLDIALYGVRLDMMIYKELHPLTEEFFIGKISKMPEFKRFKEAVKEFVD